MLEIILLIFLCKKIGAIIREKGRSPVAFQVLTVFLWFGGEIAGAVVGIIVSGNEEPGPAAYIFALVGAAVGATIAFLIASNLSTASSGSDYRPQG